MIFGCNAKSYLNVRIFIFHKLNQMEKQFLARLVKTQYILTTDKDNWGIRLIDKAILLTNAFIPLWKTLYYECIIHYLYIIQSSKCLHSSVLWWVIKVLPSWHLIENKLGLSWAKLSLIRVGACPGNKNQLKSGFKHIWWNLINIINIMMKFHYFD